MAGTLSKSTRLRKASHFQRAARDMCHSRRSLPRLNLELMALVDPFSGFNMLMDGLQVEPDEKPWHG